MSDLDDEELKATRRLNGADKENYNIERDVERCKQLIRAEHANWIGISNQLAIKHILEELEQDKKRIKELEEKYYYEKNRARTELDTVYIKARYDERDKWISLVKDKLENETIDISGFKCIAVEDLEELLEDK